MCERGRKRRGARRRTRSARLRAHHGEPAACEWRVGASMRRRSMGRASVCLMTRRGKACTRASSSAGQSAAARQAPRSASVTRSRRQPTCRPAKLAGATREVEPVFARGGLSTARRGVLARIDVRRPQARKNSVRAPSNAGYARQIGEGAPRGCVRSHGEPEECVWRIILEQHGSLA